MPRLVPVACLLCLLSTLYGPTFAIAQVSCTITYNCHGSNQCASLVGGSQGQTLNFSSAADCRAQAQTVGDVTIASCSCGPSSSSTASAIPSSVNSAVTSVVGSISYQLGYALGQQLHNALFVEAPRQSARQSTRLHSNMPFSHINSMTAAFSCSIKKICRGHQRVPAGSCPNTK
jgi:hypothetical protein